MASWLQQALAVVSLHHLSSGEKAAWREAQSLEKWRRVDKGCPNKLEVWSGDQWKSWQDQT